VLCIGGGPSLTREDVAFTRGRVDATVAINNAYQLAPWAEVLYAADAKWWRWHEGAPTFSGLKFCLTDNVKQFGVPVLQSTGERGLEPEPTGLRTGRESGYQAINLAVHLGATRILLLGYDMQRGPNGEHHWHPNHPEQFDAKFGDALHFYPSMLVPLTQLGVEVINCTRRSALETFPCARLQDVI
jgi:hypothetical protein